MEEGGQRRGSSPGLAGWGWGWEGEVVREGDGGCNFRGS